MLGHRSVLRDVIARYAVHVDDAPLTRLDKKINKLSDNIKRFGAVAATAFTAAAYGAFQLAEAASSAEETFAGLGELFGKQGALQVRDWAKRTGDEMSRSEYMLEKSAFDFGKFLTPQLKDPELVGQWSKRLSKLAVDLASFNDTSDAEAMMRLFSGVSGETEAVRRLGIDISDTALDNLNKSKGGKQGGKRMASLTLAEKTLLRMEKIMIDSEKAQGDAVRSADRWAGRLKRVQGVLHRMAVIYGTKLLPYGVKFLKFIEKFLERAQYYLDVLVSKTNTFQALLFMAKVAAGLLALDMAKTLALSIAMDYYTGKLWSNLAKSLGPAAAITAAFLAIEDVMTFMADRDNKSFLGAWAQTMTGMQKPLDLVQIGFQKLENMAHNVKEYFRVAMSYAMGLVHAQGGRMKEAKAAFGVQGDFRETGTIALMEARDKAANARFEAAVQRGDLTGASENTRINEDQYGAYNRAVALRKKLVQEGKVQADGNDVVSGFVPNARFVGPTGDFVSEKGPWDPSKKDWTVERGSGSVTVTNHNTFNVKGDPKDIAKAVNEEGSKSLRQAAQALKRQGGN